MYKFNQLLYRNLNKLVGMTQVEFSKMVYKFPNKYAMSHGNEDNIRVFDLIGICNILRISFSHFISTGESDAYTSDVSRYIIDDTIFKPIIFKCSSMNKLYGKNGITGLTRNELAKEIGISSMSVYLYSIPESCTMKIKTLLEICNKFGINIDLFIHDHNVPLPPYVGEQSASNTYDGLMKEVLMLRNIVAEDKKKIIHLSNENAQLKIAGRRDLVAEDTTGYNSGDRSVRQWRFNKELLDSLPALLEVSMAKLFTDVGMSNPAISYNDGDILVETLINLCNKYSISVRHFFVRGTGNMECIKGIKDYRSDPFVPVSFHAENINDIFGKESLTGLSLAEVLQAIGCSYMKLYEWKDEEHSSMRVSGMIELCNALDVSPFCFISDENKVNSYSMTQAEFFMEENRMLHMKIIKLNKKIQSLKKKIK